VWSVFRAPAHLSGEGTDGAAPTATLFRAERGGQEETAADPRKAHGGGYQQFEN
jgi:hypothetical protein